jgi:hypothetical protein
MADPDPSLTPEKRLLQLIEGHSGEQSGKSATKKADFLSNLKGKLSPEGIKEWITETKENLVSMIKRRDFVNLGGVNAAAKVFTILLGIYLLLNVIYEIKVVNGNYVSNLQMPQREMAEIAMSKNKVFDTNLLNEAEKLNIFVPYSKREVKTEEKKDEMSLKLVSLIKDWKLAGISIYPDHPEQSFCMVEDLQKNTTTFLKVGDTISGLKVDKINSDSVVLRFNEETIELR